MLGAACAKLGLSCPTSPWCSQGSWTNIPGVSLPLGAARMGFGTHGEGESHLQQRARTPSAAAVRGARVLSHEQNGCRQRFFSSCPSLQLQNLLSLLLSPRESRAEREDGCGCGCERMGSVVGLLTGACTGCACAQSRRRAPLRFYFYLFIFFIIFLQQN